MLDVAFLQALICNERAEAIGRDAAGYGAVLARCRLAETVHLAVGELHRVTAMIAEAPMATVALDRETTRGAFLLRLRCRHGRRFFQCRDDLRRLCFGGV